MPKQTFVRKTTYGLPEMTFFIGSLLALMGGLSSVPTHSDQVINYSGAISPSVIERKLSIEEAMKNGQKTYQFQSRSIPGIGVISDPKAFLGNWQKEVKQSEKN